MIIETRYGDILKGKNKRIAFAINAEGINDTGFVAKISAKYWPELTNYGEMELGSVLRKKVGNIEFFALVCHSLENGWINQTEVIKMCFDAIPGEEPIATVRIGSGLIGFLEGADIDQILEGMEASKKKIILY